MRFAQPPVIAPERWERMSKAQKAVAVAKDAVFRAETGQFTPRRGIYTNFGLGRLLSKPHPNAEIKTLLRANAQCECCALGGAICSLAAFQGDISNGEGSPSGPTEVKLVKIFGRRNMDRIEETFELYDNTGPFGRRASAFLKKRKCESISQERARFIAIWRNVARNKGVFRP